MYKKPSKRISSTIVSQVGYCETNQNVGDVMNTIERAMTASCTMVPSVATVVATRSLIMYAGVMRGRVRMSDPMNHMTSALSPMNVRTRLCIGRVRFLFDDVKYVPFIAFLILNNEFV